MSNSVRFKFTNDSKPPRNGVYNIKLRIKFGTLKKGRQIGVEVDKAQWDEKNGRIKPLHNGLYESELARIRDIEDRFSHIRKAITEGNMTLETAFSVALNKVEDDYLEEFWSAQQPEPTKKLSTIIKHRTNISAIQSRCIGAGRNHLKKLKFSHLADEEVVKDIAKVLVSESELSDNTLDTYFKTLNRSTSLKGFPEGKQRPFKKYIPSIKPSKKTKSISKDDLLMKLKNINTLHQFEAYMFWLYSFCLMGLDGTDVCNISEEKIIGGRTEELSDYIPDLQNTTKVRVGLSRGKSDVDFMLMVNLFPTLMIRDILHYLISINSPSDAYKGDDRLRLYNFTTRDERGREDAKGLSKWTTKRKSYVQALRKRVDTTNQDTRKTVTRIAGDLNIPIDKIDILLNHTIKGVMKHYVEEKQQERDVYHIHILQEFGIIELLRDVINYLNFHDKSEIISARKLSFIPKEESFWRKFRSNRTENIKINELTGFTVSDEMEYQRLRAKHTKGNSFFNPETGDIEFKEVDFDSYPDRLKELHYKRKNISEARILKQIFG